MSFAPAPGRVLEGRYTLREPLGHGGMGTVWSAEHVKLKTAVAVKLIASSIAASEEAQTRFRREAQVAASLESQNIVRILDFGIEDDTPFIVMELLQGETLGARLARAGALSPQDTSRIVAQVARGIGKAHQARVVHCDLKPENVFLAQVDGDEIAKVVDFGIAKAPTLDPVTKTGTVLGTLQYMSPEQLEGRKGIDARSDLYSLAIIAFECLCGRPAFKADSIAELVRRICGAPLPVPSDIARVPTGFDAWFTRAAHRDPAMRFANARELTDALTALVSAAPARAVPPDRESSRRVAMALEPTMNAPRANGSERAGFRVTPDARRRMLELELWGFWDMPLALSFKNELLAAFETMKGSPWVRLVILRNHPPQKDEIQELKKPLMSGAVLAECERAAIIAESSLTQMQVSRLFTEGHTTNVRFFTDERAARAWLGDAKVFVRRGGSDVAGFEVHPNPASRVLSLRFWGAWDLALAHAFRTEVFRAYDEMDGAPYVVLSEARRFLVQKDEVHTVHRETIDVALRRGLVRVAVLVDSALSKMQIRRLFEEAGSPPHLRFFTDDKEARAWLAEAKVARIH